MTLARKIYLAIIMALGLIGELLFLGLLAATPVGAGEAPASSNSSIRALGLPQGSLRLLSLSPVIVGGRSIGALAVYDDPQTRRSEDYLELYDSDGGLVAVGWFDRFGIQRVAVDRALVEGKEKLQGVFVTVEDGDPV